MAELTLLRGQIAIIDDEDLPRVAGYRWLLSAKGYVICMTGPRSARKSIWLHRLIAGTPNGFDTDHRNRNKLDNRKSNLRVATRRQNTGNRVVNKAHCTSKFKGVHRHTDGRWRARFGYLTPDGKRKYVHLGLFGAETDAADAYDKYAISHFGSDFALLNNAHDL